MKRMKKTLCILLSLLMVLAMIPGTALATTGLTLHGGGYTAYPGNSVENGIFTREMTVQYDGRTLSDSEYSVSVDESEGTVTEKTDGTFTFVAKKVGICPVSITYNGVPYQFNFSVHENDLPYTKYYYNLDDEEIMLPHNGRGLSSQISGEKFDGNRFENNRFDISSIVSSDSDVVRVTERDNGGYDIDAVSLGEAVITITHGGFDNTEVKKNITIHVTSEKWYCEISEASDCMNMLPGTSKIFWADVEKYIYDSEEDSVQRDNTAVYTAVWSVEDTSLSNVIGLAPAGHGESCTVSVPLNVGKQNIPVRVDIISGSNPSPVASGYCEIRVRQEYYTIETPGFTPDLQKGDSMVVTPMLQRHYLENNMPQMTPVPNATFECTRSNNLNISKNGNSFEITRSRGGNADFRVAAYVNDDCYAERELCLNWIDDRLNTYMIFSRTPITGNDYSQVVSHVKLSLTEGSDAPVSEDYYVYIATKTNGVITSIKPVRNGINAFYCTEDMGNGPEYDENTQGLTIKKIIDDGIHCQYEFTLDPSAYNGFKTGMGKYDLYPSGIEAFNLELTVQKLAPVSREEHYGISLEMLQDPADYGETSEWMWVDGQGSSMPFTNKITNWDTCFYVENLRTGLDARFIPEDGKDEIRTYIGNPGNFVIEVQERGKESNGWILQDSLTEEQYKVYEIIYIGYKKNFYPVFNIRYTKASDVVEAASEKYRYRLHFIGDDPYLGRDIEDNRYCIELEFDNNLQEFDIDEYFRYNSGSWGTGNWHYFNKVGTELLMKKIIRPGVLKSVEDKTVYDKNDYIYIEDEAERIGFYRAEYGTEGKSFVKLETAESPFSIIWNDAEKHYVVTYDKPANDIYGPEYYMIYEGDYNAKINAKYNTTGTHNVGNISSLVTGKLTVRANAEEVASGTVDASTNDENINATEVIFGIDVLNNLNKELKIKTKHGEISFTGDIVDNLKSTQSSEASFEMRDVMTDGYGLTNGQKNALHNCDVAFDFDITSGEAKVEFGQNGTAAIVIPFEDTSKAVYYLDENGKMYPVEYVFDQGHVKFIAKHFSTYVVADKGLGEDPEPTPSIPGGLPATSTDKVTQSGDTTTADLSGSTTSKGGETTTTVDQTTADKLVEMAVKNNSEEIVINAVTKNESAASSTKAAEVVLTGDTLQTIAEKTDADVVIQTNVAEVKLDNKTAEAVVSQTAEGETVSIIAEKVKEEAKEVQFELKIVTSSGKVISDFDGGSVAVTVNVPKSLSNKKVVCVYIDEKGHMHKVDGTLNADGTYTFTTGHFSTYALMDEEEAEAAIEAQKEAVKALKPTLRSSQVKTKSGKKAVKLTWKDVEDIQLDGIEIYRSLKKSSGYGKEPFYTTAKTSYMNTSVKAGKKYYYKVRGFVTIDGEKVYTQYSTKAWRTVK